jgi:hypothetical protein
MFESLDKPRTQSRKSLLLLYFGWIDISLFLSGLSIYRYFHRMHPQPWIYAGLAFYPAALLLSVWCFTRTLAEPDGQVEVEKKYWLYIYLLTYFPGFIHFFITGY